jgi:hypothetical protein
MSSSKKGLALLADLVVVTLLVAGTIAFLTPDLSVRFLGLRISMRSAWRPYLWAAIILIIRNLLVRRPPSFAWVLVPFRGLTRTGLRAELAQALPIGEAALFDDRPWSQRLKELSLLVAGYTALVVALTWPQIRRLDSVADLGDPLFSIWRIAWVAHQLPRHPLALFDANQFYPERLTLTYSDSLIVPSLMSAPFFWLGGNPVVIYNLLLLSGFVLSGVTMFLLTRALTGRTGAAIVGGAIFALYPYRLEHYSHLELQMTMWMPLALLWLHRTLARGRWRDGLATGVAFALQTLSSLYYGCFLAVFMTVAGGVVWLARGRPRAPILPLAAGALLAAVLIAPVAVEYTASRPMMGTREEGTIRFYSAIGSDYLSPHFRNRIYARWSEGGQFERQLFPRITPVVLTAVAIWPPLSIARIAYVLALAVSVDGSFGLNGATFTSLHAVLSPFKGLRVPARFSLLAGMALAILAAYGAARLLARWPRHPCVLTTVIVGVIAIEALPQMPLERVWPEPPAIYASIAYADPPAVLAEFPMPRDFYQSDFDTRYLYFSTFHWQNLVNGNSGFFPPSYKELLAEEQDFPNDDALAYLKSRGVQYVTIHGRFTNPERYRETVAWLDARADVALVAAAPWEGGESRLYRLR